jgi:hypothetical protein
MSVVQTDKFASPRVREIFSTRRQKFAAAVKTLVEFKDTLAHSHVSPGPIHGCLKCDTNVVLNALDRLKRRHFPK